MHTEGPERKLTKMSAGLKLFLFHILVLICPNSHRNEEGMPNRSKLPIARISVSAVCLHGAAHFITECPKTVLYHGCPKHALTICLRTMAKRTMRTSLQKTIRLRIMFLKMLSSQFCKRDDDSCIISSTKQRSRQIEFRVRTKWIFVYIDTIACIIQNCYC